MSAAEVARPEKGTLWVAANGDAYRLRGYRSNFGGGEDEPSYDLSYARGMHSTTYALPDDAVMVWTPGGEA